MPPLNKLELIIKSKGERDKDKTAAIPRRRAAIHGRRRIQGGIRIFDFGYQKVGETYQTVAYLDPYRTAPIKPSNFGVPFASGLYPLDLTRVEDLNDLIFTVPTDQWTSTFHRYDYEYANAAARPDGMVEDLITINWRGTGNYSLEVGATGFDDVFINDKFYPPDGESDDSLIVSGLNSTMFHDFNTSTNKVTTEYNYAADAVAFVPSRTMDIFMMPVLNRVYGYAQHIDTAPDPDEGVTRLLGFNFIVYPRETTFNASYDYYNLGYLGPGDVSTLTQTVNTNSLTSNTYGFISKGWTFIQGEHPHFAREDTFSGSWSASSIDPSAVYPTTYYPEYPTLPPTSPASTAAAFGFSQGQYVAGQLLAIIRQSGQLYYVWATSDFLTY